MAIGPGLLADADAELKDAYPRRRTVIVTDATVAALHAAPLQAALQAGGIDAGLIVLPPGEETKSFDGLADLSDRLLALSLDRGDVITALGGGVIGDLTGFAAAIYKRGIDFVQIPTHPPGPGGLLRRRQDRHRHAPRQEPDRRPSTSRAGCWPTWTC